MSKQPLLASLVDTESNLPDRPAVRIGPDSLSRGELVEAAAAVANEIAGANAVAIDAVASLETIVAVVACLMAGTPAVPVPPDSGPIERGHILKDSGAVLILGAAREEVVTIPSVPVDVRARSSATQREPDDRSTAFIMYTSGTTGRPKGVVLSASATPSKPAATAVRRLPHRRGRSRAGHP